MIKAIDNLFADFVPSSIHHSDISGPLAPSRTAQALHIDRIEVSTPQFLTNQEAEEALAMVGENVTTSPADALSVHQGLDVNRVLSLLDGL